MNGVMQGFPPINYTFPNLNGKRVLSVGIGGGSDCISAYALAAWLRENNPDADVMYASCVKHPKQFSGFQETREGVFKRSQELMDGRIATINIMLGLPRDKFGSPFALHMPDNDARRPEIMQNMISVIEPDIIFAIDTGGDGLTGGAKEKDKENGDRKSLRALRKCGASFVFLVFGPGCDGESTIEEMEKAIRRENESNAFLGGFDLREILEVMSPHEPSVREDGTPNTPNVMMDAKREIDKDPACASFLHLVRRHKNPRIPRRWLTSGAAFDGRKVLAHLHNGD